MKTNLKQSIIALMLASLMATPMAMAAGEPGNVNNVVVTPKDATTLSLKWDAAVDKEGNPVDHYRIYYGTASVQKAEAANYDAEVNTPDNQTAYDLTGLVESTPYYISVTAIDASDVESLEYSIEATGTPSAQAQNQQNNQENQNNQNSQDKVAPTVINAIASDKNHVLIAFSEKVVLPANAPEAAFSVTEQINSNNVLEVKSAQLYADDAEGKTVVVETADQTKNVNYLITVGVAVTDMANNPIQSGNTDSALFLGSDATSSIVTQTNTENTQNTENTENAENLLNETPNTDADTTAPEDVTDLALNFKQDLENFMVMMSWTPSLNSAKDLVDQVLYQSLDMGATYGPATSLGALATEHEVSGLEAGKEYTFKITTKDGAGNESVGVIKSIRLPQTGFGAGALLLGSMLGANRILRRRKDQ